jgi:hypothetical protein
MERPDEKGLIEAREPYLVVNVSGHDAHIGSRAYGECAEDGINVAPAITGNLVESPGTRALPVKIAEAFCYLHTQDRSCWTHELQLTPFRDEAELLGLQRWAG